MMISIEATFVLSIRIFVVNVKVQNARCTCYLYRNAKMKIKKSFMRHITLSINNIIIGISAAVKKLNIFLPVAF